MAKASIDFNASDIAVQAESASQLALDELPFGVIELDRHGTVLFYSATEVKLSGVRPLGLNLFDVSRCANCHVLRERIMAAMESGPVDMELAWVGDHGDPLREVRIRVQSARRGGVWMFIERD